MQDKDLYQQLLGLKKPWEVSELKVDYVNLAVEVWIKWPKEAQAPCPVCDKLCSIYDHRGEREWRHLDTMQFRTILHCNIPRINCSEHGVKSIEVSWSERQSRFTTLFERFAINVLASCQNQTKAMELLQISWNEIHFIQERAVKRGLSRRTTEESSYIGVDEKSFLKGHKYATIMYDLEESKVLDVAKDRKEESLSALFETMTKEQKDSIKAISVDMWEPFRTAIEKHIPNADIVHDKFHIIKYLGEAVDKVRRSENSEFLKNGNDLLKGTKYLWLTNSGNWNEKQQKSFYELRKEELKVGRAWSMKEMFSGFWEHLCKETALEFFNKWYWWATHSGLKPMSDVAKMLKRHIDNILTYIEHKITNAVAEGINSKIQQIKATARGFRNFNNYRIAILFFCGKLDLYPHSSM